MANEQELGIQQWAKDAYANGAREEDKYEQARQFVTVAPDDALIEAVAAYMGTLLHKLALAQERDMGSWQEPEPPARRGTRTQNRRVPIATNKQQMQLDEKRYVPGKGMVAWRDITLKDIDAAIAFYRKTIGGIERSIAVWDSARALMIKHGAKTLGDVPSFDPDSIPDE